MYIYIYYITYSSWDLISLLVLLIILAESFLIMRREPYSAFNFSETGFVWKHTYIWDILVSISQLRFILTHTHLYIYVYIYTERDLYTFVFSSKHLILKLEKKYATYIVQNTRIYTKNTRIRHKNHDKNRFLNVIIW